MKKKLTFEERKERFFSRVQKTDSCWEWIGAKSDFGHGRFYNGQTAVGAHRFSWGIFNGFEKLKPGFHICHKCNNPSCVNPEHLYQGSPQENADDCTNSNRRNAAKGIKNYKAKLNDDAVRYIRENAKIGDNVSQGLCMVKYDISQGAIYEILKGRLWKHVK